MMREPMELMEMVNRHVRGGDWGTALAENILNLCRQLKAVGMDLEMSNKAALNNVFVSLRQAACRDGGQLGRECRLRIMETIELRAMKWRCSLSHSHYYANKATTPCAAAPPPRLPPLADPPGFYLVPAIGNFGLPLLAPFFSLPMQSPMIPKKVKATPFREEMVIRNGDSGKLMGVRGRRVALVEAMTDTVISFQKTDPKNKQRILTLTANSEEAIERAKQLIEETIRRNASPEGQGRIPSGTPYTYSREQLLALSHNHHQAIQNIRSIAPELMRN